MSEEANPAPTFDLAIGLHQNLLQKVLKKVYDQLYPSYFTGKNTFQQAGVNFDVSWDVKSVPILDLSPAPALLELVADMLPPELQAQNLDLSAATEDPGTFTFRVRFPSIALVIENGGVKAPTTADATAYLQATTENNQITFKPLKATATTPRREDQWLLDKFIIPQALKLAASMMGAITIPDLDFPGRGKMWPMPVLHENYLVILANVPGNHYPLGIDVKLPIGTPLFAAVKNMVIAQALIDATRGRREEYSDGSDDFFAGWDVHVTVDNIRYEGIQGLRVQFSLHAEGSARGWLVRGVGMNFKIVTQPPNLRGTVRVDVDWMNNIRAQVDQVEPFMMMPIPQGNIVEQVISAIMGPLMGAIFNYTGRIQQFVRRIGFDVWRIPEIPVALDKVRFVLKPAGLRLTPADNCAALIGDVELK